MNHKVFIIMIVIVITAVLCGILITKGPYARASNKYASASYSKEGGGYKAIVQFSNDLTDVSAVHIHRGEGGGVGPIITWLATTTSWQTTQTQVNLNAPCCQHTPTNNCTLQAPVGTYEISYVAGKTIEYDIPYASLSVSCQAAEHLNDKNVYLVVHGFDGLSAGNQDIIAHTKFN